MKNHARVVIIGGGVVGCSTLYYLSKYGWTDVVLVERLELTAGTTWHSAGNVVLADSNRASNQLNLQAYNLYRTMEKETGEYLGWSETGAILIAKTRDLLDRYTDRAASIRAVGIDYEMIGPEEIQKLHPLMTIDGVLGAAFLPKEGVLDPSMTTQAFARAARKNGAEIYRHTKVTGLTEQLNGEWKVTTDKGEIIAEFVVIAAGFWSPVLARMVGAHIPIVPTERQYLVTEEVPEISKLNRKLPMLRDFAVPFYVRQERMGLLVGVHEPHTPYCFVDGIPENFGQELFPVDLERGAHSLESAIARVPALGRVGIKSEVCGPTSRTPDLQGVMGPIPGLRNIHVAAGFTSGISQGAALGHLAAEWLMQGTPSVDVSMVSLTRFGRYANPRFIRSMLAEAHVFGTVDLSAERKAGRPARTSALYHRLAEEGAQFASRLGWEIPMWFNSSNKDSSTASGDDLAREESKNVQESVGILDLSSLAKYEVSGPDAANFLDQLYAQRLPDVGGITFGPMLSKTGQVMGLVTVARLAANHFYLTAAPQAELHHYAWLHSHLPVSSEVRLDNVTGRYGVLLLAGPKAHDVLERVTDTKLMNANFPLMTVADIDVNFSPVRLLRFSMVGELGWELHHPIEYQVGLYEALISAGKDWGIQNFGFKAYDILRKKNDWPIWEKDFTSTPAAKTAGLDRFIDSNKKNF